MAILDDLNTFYLGQLTTGEPLLYPSKQLRTHGFCVGMTGSGKTGLCIDLVEEAALDGIPAVVFDLKGDLANLFLQFPALQPADFEPWVVCAPGESPEGVAQQRAEAWRAGIEASGMTTERLAALQDRVDWALYTPGSKWGRPLSLLSVLDRPHTEDEEALEQARQTAVSALLGLLKLPEDPLKPETLLLSAWIESCWQTGESGSLAALVNWVKTPSIDQLGILPLEQVMPAAQRLQLAQRINAVLASPQLAGWLTGEPLDFGRLLYGPEGRPRVSVLSVAGLREEERMLCLTLVLRQALTWMRQQAGCPTLRALLVLDEIYGLLPPTAQPPTKDPLMQLLKQARAYGLGLLLSSQNPVDLDYKALANCGTWWVGRLQTAQDRARLLDGIQTAGAGESRTRGEWEQVLSQLKPREFVQMGAYNPEPICFSSRHCLSYLAGPLTSAQVKTLIGVKPPLTPPVAMEPTPPRPSDEPLEARPPVTGQQPALPPGLTAFYEADATPPYRPWLRLRYAVDFVRASEGQRLTREEIWQVPLPTHGQGIDWQQVQVVWPAALAQVLREPPVPGEHRLGTDGLDPKQLQQIQRQLTDWVYSHSQLTGYRSAVARCQSELGETEGEFRARLHPLFLAALDQAMDQLGHTYHQKLDRLDQAAQRLSQQTTKLQEQASQRKWDVALNAGGSLLRSFLRKGLGVGTAQDVVRVARSASKTLGQGQRIEQAQEKWAALQTQRAELEAAFEAEVNSLRQRLETQWETLEPVIVRPLKRDVRCLETQLIWRSAQKDREKIEEDS